jgi:DNA-binding NarL/FixJ family response regulator
MSPVRAVALTGLGTAEDVGRVLRAGFSGLLLKPVEFGTLGEAVERVAAGEQLLPHGTGGTGRQPSPG